ncbi:MAG: Crp/Fnr family transcriptional regulator [Desulfobacterales bacterium]|nr:Crp/Fnr family transcriptional regulator [Desulfobacterales bacterium]
MNAHESFINTLSAIVPLPRDQAAKLKEIARPLEIEKGQSFIRTGEIPDRLGFLVSGLFRYYYLTPGGQEFTKGFFRDRSILSSYSAMIQGRESFFTIQALEDLQILEIRYRNWKPLVENHLCWSRIMLALVEKGFCIKEARERAFLLDSAEERYREFLAAFPGLDRRVRQHMIASYLGITPVALSRIRKRMGLVNPG